MKKIFKYWVIGLFVYWIILPSKAVASPIESLSLSPIISDVSLAPGTSTTITYTLRNTSDAPLGIHIQPDQLVTDGIQISSQKSLAPWIQLSQQDIIIDPQQTSLVTVIITPPKNTPDGGYYSALTFTPFVSRQKDLIHPVVLTNIQSLVLGTVGNVNYKNLSQKTTITDLSFTNMHHATLSLTNNYFTHFAAKPFITITPLFGKPQLFHLTEKHLLPGMQKSWDEPLSGISQNHLFYKISLVVSVGQGFVISKTGYAILVPNLMPYIFIGIIILLLWLLRRRIGRVFTILVRG